jgi:hypothetical protein
MPSPTQQLFDTVNGRIEPGMVNYARLSAFLARSSGFGKVQFVMKIGVAINSQNINSKKTIYYKN